MLDAAYFKELLDTLGNASYMGVKTSDLMERFATDGEGKRAEFSETAQKFKYHMDEAWNAGLIRDRDNSTAENWGLKVGATGNWVYQNRPLVLTPLGGELLKELNKPKGLERLKQALRNAGSAAGTEALKFGIDEILKVATS
jgi:hypothetical protein